MDESLREAYLGAVYRVCIGLADWVRIVPGERLPLPLREIAGDAPWGLVTAWNPRSARLSDDENLVRQRELLALLDDHAGTARMLPAIGIGRDGWHEPSLFVVGPDMGTFDALMRRFHQHAYLRGDGGSPAVLRWTPP